ncbi:MAG: sulfotransferase family 2 domain-containing protein [Pseudomonadota bacterium]
MMMAPGPLKSAFWTLERQLPEPARLAMMSRRRRGHWRRTGVIFIHVPKAAGTSVSTALYGRALGHFPAAVVARHCPDLWRDLPSFAVIRDPVERAHSAWRFARQGGTEAAGAGASARGAVSGAGGFADFVERLAGMDLTRADPVFRPQVGFVCGPDQALLPDAVFRLEALAKAEVWLGQRLGREIGFPRLNRSDGMVEQIDPALAQQIGDIYAADSALFHSGQVIR